MENWNRCITMIKRIGGVGHRLTCRFQPNESHYISHGISCCGLFLRSRASVGNFLPAFSDQCANRLGSNERPASWIVDLQGHAGSVLRCGDFKRAENLPFSNEGFRSEEHTSELQSP